MDKNKYFDFRNNKFIDFEDGCSLEEWSKNSEKYSFAIHENGFLIFLPPEKIETFDEYKDSDPYSVEINLESDFHKRRTESTISLLSAIRFPVDKNIKILDLGCGQGHLTNKIANNFPDADISALDYSVSAIKYASDHFKKIDFVVGDAFNPPYSHNYFDVIICNNLWEHVPDPLRLLTVINKLLKEKSYMIISTPSRYRVENIIRIFSKKPLIFMSDLHVTEYTVGQVKEQLDFGGFDVVKFDGELIDSEQKIINASFKYKMLFFVIKNVLRRRKLEHSLSSTVFYLAVKR